MSIELVNLIAYNLLKTHPIGQQFKNLWSSLTFSDEDYETYETDERDFIKINKEMIKQFNNSVCSICYKYCKETGKTCLKCNKYTCYSCDPCKIYCKKCIDKCFVCGNYSKCYDNLSLGQCYSCKRHFCVDYYDRSKHKTLKACITYINNKCYTFCNKKCIPFSFFKEQVIISLNRLFRKKRLRNSLKLYNLKIRYDSTLCEKYIDGLLDKVWTSEKVAQKMCEMKYLFEYCNMSCYLNEVSDDLIEDRIQNIKSGNDKTTYHSSPRFHLAKEEILRRIGDFPIVWPWETKYKQSHKENLNKVLDIIKILPPISGGSLGGIFYQEKEEANKHFFKHT